MRRAAHRVELPRFERGVVLARASRLASACNSPRLRGLVDIRRTQRIVRCRPVEQAERPASRKNNDCGTAYLAALICGRTVGRIRADLSEALSWTTTSVVISANAEAPQPPGFSPLKRFCYPPAAPYTSNRHQMSPHVRGNAVSVPPSARRSGYPLARTDPWKPPAETEQHPSHNSGRACSFCSPDFPSIIGGVWGRQYATSAPSCGALSAPCECAFGDNCEDSRN